MSSSSQPFTDDDDVAGFALDGDDAVAGAQRFVSAADVFERGGDVVVIVWVFVRQHQLGGGRDGAGLVAVDLFDLWWTTPPFIGEVKAVPAHRLKCAASQCLFDWRIAIRHCHDSKITRWSARVCIASASI